MASSHNMEYHAEVKENEVDVYILTWKDGAMCYFSVKKKVAEPWLLWLSGLSASL